MVSVPFSSLFVPYTVVNVYIVLLCIAFKVERYTERYFNLLHVIEASGYVMSYNSL